MRRIKALDLFCGAGGASMGLHRAGYEVIGVDINPQPNYPFEFVQADALEYPLNGFDLIWASPPCQAFTRLKALNNNDYPDLIRDIRTRFKSELHSGVSTIIENVVRAPLINPIMLCGSMFGLGVWRHRIFECSFNILTQDCQHYLVPEPIDVTGTGGPCPRENKKTGGIHRKPKNIAQAKEVMGINWMTRKELSQAIPPAYSKFLASRLLTPTPNPLK